MALRKLKGKPAGWVYRSGPAAISIITGCRYEAAVEALGGESRYVADEAQMLKALFKLDWKMIRVKVEPTTTEAVLARLDNCREPKLPTLARWLKMRGDLMNDTLLVRAGNHWLVVKGRKAADNQNPNGVFIREIGYRRATIKSVWRVEDLIESNFVIVQAAHDIAAKIKADTVKMERLANLAKARAARAAKKQA